MAQTTLPERNVAFSGKPTPFGIVAGLLAVVAVLADLGTLAATAKTLGDPSAGWLTLYAMGWVLGIVVLACGIVEFERRGHRGLAEAGVAVGTLILLTRIIILAGKIAVARYLQDIPSI